MTKQGYEIDEIMKKIMQEKEKKFFPESEEISELYRILLNENEKGPPKKSEKETIKKRKKPSLLGNSVDFLSSFLKESQPKKTSQAEYIIPEYKNIEYKNIEYKNIEYKKINLEKIIEKNIYQNLYIKTSGQGINLTSRDSTSITAGNIGEFALPIVEYIRQINPDYIIACDRGARLLGLAVFKLYGELYGRLPTVDGTLRFRRISKSESQNDTEAHLRPLVEEMLEQRKRPCVLVLDDWVCSGGTKNLAKDVFYKLGKGRIEVKFGVLVGGEADISGHSSHASGFAGVTDWRDDSNIIGVRYSDSHREIRAQPVRSEQAKDYRRVMYEGIEKLARNIKNGQQD